MPPRTRVGSALSPRRVRDIVDGPLIGARRALEDRFEVDAPAARHALGDLVRHTLDTLGEAYARDMAAHIDAIVDLRARLADAVDAAVAGRDPEVSVQQLIADLETNLAGLQDVESYLRDHTSLVDDAVDSGWPGIEAAALDPAQPAGGRTGRVEPRRDPDVPHDPHDEPSGEPDGGPADADLHIRDAPPDPERVPAHRLRLLRERIGRWTDRIAALTQSTDWPARAIGPINDFVPLVTQIQRTVADLDARRRRGADISDSELADVEDLADAVSQGLRDIDPPVRREWVDNLLTRLQRELVALDSLPPVERSRLEPELRALEAEARRLAERADPAHPQHRRPPSIGRAFRDLRSRERGLRRRDGEVFVDLSDPTTRARVEAWFEPRLAPLRGAGPIGEFLADRLIASLRTRDALVLQQSPRSRGDRVQDTDQLRRDFLAHFEELPPEYRVAFLDAARGQVDGWPRTSADVPWEVDHVDELWLGGADAGPNLLALPPGLHRQHDLGGPDDGGPDPTKTGILADLRREFRETLRETDEQVDFREGDVHWPEEVP